MLNHDALCRLIPHADDMCLLDEVISWDDTSVVCRSLTHRNKQHPLRENGRLAAVHAAEYGAQAMAVHGGLLASRDGEKVRPGYLVSLRNLVLHVSRLDTVDSALTVTATQLMANSSNLIYAFQLHADGSAVAEGKATVMAIPEQPA
jgi:predicted hotdog family 3-hydroxylacyl-ACP dehydratase